MNKTEKVIHLHDQYGAKNYLPLPVVLSKGEGVWVEDIEGKKYLDMLSAYSALNQGHRHPKIISALKEQADRITLTSRAFHNDKLPPFYEKLAHLTNMEMILPMNTGAEAVETAIKAARRWAYQQKGVKNNEAEIIVCKNNFHGRTITAVSLSSSAEYKKDFGPLLSGIKTIPFGDSEALRNAITPNTAAFLTEPIQGEAGIIIPPKGYLKEVEQICRQNNIIFIADEIQSGLGRTGKLLTCEWENVKPDMVLLGKALGGGVFPISAVCSKKEMLAVFEPGSHGSTFGGNPLAAAVALASLEVIEKDKLWEKSYKLGEWFIKELASIKHPLIKEIRGKGLFIGMELHIPARPYCEKLKNKGLLCKETHENVIRLAPPLIVKKEELEWALEKIKKAFNN
ncbi:ornithine--oxo-acid transaminase [Alteribacillus sp. JSM 102045]|uniref:ornithine--oxo-acid transaminase n=1 Tax=Alteribacillus sp. JSM 102045 TaxID=1562101 RepID=UPI0035C04CE2